MLLRTMLLVLFVCLLPPHCLAHVKSILGHTASPSGSLAAQYYNEHQDSSERPSCAGGGGGNYSDVTYCIKDPEYPLEQIEHAIKYHYHAVASIYKDVILNTDLSVDDLATLEQERYFLCPALVEYTRPLRAVNSHGEWSIIVNDIPASYDHLTQTVRIEKCLYGNHPCPLLPDCYASKCVQKYAYHRFLVYNPKDYYYPFKVESLKLPSSCDCLSGEFDYYGYEREYEKRLEYDKKTEHSQPPTQLSLKEEKEVPHYVDKTLG